MNRTDGAFGTRKVAAGPCRRAARLGRRRALRRPSRSSRADRGCGLPARPCPRSFSPDQLYDLTPSPNWTITKYYAGLDWGECHHDIAVVDEAGQLVSQLRLTDDANGLAQLLAALAAVRRNRRSIPIGIETGRGLMVTGLLKIPALPRSGGPRAHRIGGPGASAAAAPGLVGCQQEPQFSRQMQLLVPPELLVYL
ncbi:transposase [Micromonospora sp. NPDC000316]|uniref:IS110 family transposase n=1 Tax=Micromonospora sp. NPDC000316 TaxID=3364216 RepID=UPI0036A54D5E